jgi:DnaJ-domain-containing protein 1
MKAKRPFMSGYKTYDVEVEGYGSPSEWREAFHAAMGLDEAVRRVGKRTAEEILGVGVGCAWQAIRSAYRRLAQQVHPDMCATHGLPVDVATERFKELTAAYVVLERKYGKS